MIDLTRGAKRVGVLVCAAICCLVWAAPGYAQGVTTGTLTGVVSDSQGGVLPGATVVAIHQPSGTEYTAVTQGDGRFVIPAMRVGGPYKVNATLSGFGTEVKEGVTVSLGTSTDLTFGLKPATLTEEVTVLGSSDAIFGSQRTGAATSVTRTELESLPTISGRINDVTRLTPQYGGGGSFAGQDNRMNNITVDGSYFNNSFGLGGPAWRPHGRRADLAGSSRADPGQRRAV